VDTAELTDFCKVTANIGQHNIERPIVTESETLVSL
jgi:hypothetical protein